jgi:hypothetical protein
LAVLLLLTLQVGLLGIVGTVIGVFNVLQHQPEPDQPRRNIQSGHPVSMVADLDHATRAQAAMRGLDVQIVADARAVITNPSTSWSS